MWWYSLGIAAYTAAIKVAAHWNPKARLWVDGRKGIFERLREAVGDGKRVVWIHVSSLGEFEQGRPIIEQFRKLHPEYKILLTFFSPSGYEARKDWKTVDWVFYLPLDTCFNAKKFVETVRPSKAIFTIGEMWFNYLNQLKRHNVDTYIMSVLATKDSAYLKWYGGPYRKVLKSVRLKYPQVQN